MAPTPTKLLPGSAAPVSRGSPGDRSDLPPDQLAPVTAQAHHALAESPDTPARIETLDRTAHRGRLPLRYDPGDPAVDDAIAVAWLVTMLPSAGSIVLAEDGCVTPASVERALRELLIAVGEGHGRGIVEALVIDFLDAAHAGYGRRLQLWSERCPDTGGRAVVIAPELQASCPQGGSDQTMITFPSHRHTIGARNPRGARRLCRWTAMQLAKADVLRIEPPDGRWVPQHLQTRLAHARTVAVSNPGPDAEQAAQDLLGEVSDWLGGAPVAVSVTVGSDTGVPDARVFSELVIAQGADVEA